MTNNTSTSVPPFISTSTPTFSIFTYSSDLVCFSVDLMQVQGLSLIGDVLANEPRPYGYLDGLQDDFEEDNDLATMLIAVCFQGGGYLDLVLPAAFGRAVYDELNRAWQAWQTKRNAGSPQRVPLRQS